MRSEGNWYVEDGELVARCNVCGMCFHTPCTKEQEERLKFECVQDVLPDASNDLRNCLIGIGQCGLCEDFNLTIFSEEKSKQMAEGINEILRMCNQHYHVDNVIDGYQLAIDLWHGSDDKDVKDCVFLIRHYLQTELDRIWEDYLKREF